MNGTWDAGDNYTPRELVSTNLGGPVRLKLYSNRWGEGFVRPARYWFRLLALDTKNTPPTAAPQWAKIGNTLDRYETPQEARDAGIALLASLEVRGLLSRRERAA